MMKRLRGDVAAVGAVAIVLLLLASAQPNEAARLLDVEENYHNEIGLLLHSLARGLYHLQGTLAVTLLCLVDPRALTSLTKILQVALWLLQILARATQFSLVLQHNVTFE